MTHTTPPGAMPLDCGGNRAEGDRPLERECVERPLQARALLQGDDQ